MNQTHPSIFLLFSKEGMKRNFSEDFPNSPLLKREELEVSLAFD